MKLYRAKIPAIAHDVIEHLATEGDIEVVAEKKPEAEKDLAAIMDEFVRRDREFNDKVGEHMERRGISYDQRGSVRKQLAEVSDHPLGEDIERFLCRQFVEALMISPSIEEVFGEDKLIYKKIMGVLRGHDVNEGEIRDEAVSRIKNVKEGTVDYEIALEHAIRDVKKRRGLYGPERV